MDDAPKEIVSQAYNHIAEWYLSWVLQQDQRSPRERYAAKVLANAYAARRPSSESDHHESCPCPPRILELGCGPGVPVTRMLLDGGARVVANDISSAQLGLARARCPQATLLPGDMAALSFAPASFDGVVSFYAIFHLPRAEQRDMLAKIRGWLRPGGMAVFNLATVDEEEIYGEFLGYGMFWSSYSVDDSMAMVRDVGLEVVELEVLEAGDGQLDESDPDYGVKFMWVAARKGLGG